MQSLLSLSAIRDGLLMSVTPSLRNVVLLGVQVTGLACMSMRQFETRVFKANHVPCMMGVLCGKAKSNKVMLQACSLLRVAIALTFLHALQRVLSKPTKKKT